MKGVVVLSGGLDSAVNLAWAVREFAECMALTFDYGQKSARREIERSAALCAHHAVPHQVIPLPWLAGWTKTALVAQGENLPNPLPDRLDDPLASKRAADAVWVPNRNGIFLNVAAALAESTGAGVVVVGFNKEEAATFPDNGEPFVNAVNASLSFSTQNKVRVACTTLRMRKSEIVKLGIELGIPFRLIWSCYAGNVAMCGRCESCLRLRRAVQEAEPRLLEALSFAD